VDKISVVNKKIGYCTACYACKETSQCILADDMEGILDKMVSADIIVLATPVYFHTMCARIKTVIDRTLPHYTEIANKDFYFIVTMADSDKQAMERTLEGLCGFSAECLYGAKEKGVIYGSGIRQPGDVLHSGAMKQSYAMGKRV
jgi:multimeric flavodoxin WrbA